jgi:hypothetical protein
MSVDAKCYECIAGAGLEPILDKHYINSKTPFTLAKEYPKDVLKSFQADPSVPPSMKEKLGVAMGLSGGRGQASGFIMRMMAENKKKHQGQYRNPSDNDYGSSMKAFRAFDYKKLANKDQSGRNESEYGASPFIQKHFGSVGDVPFVPRAERGSDENRDIAGETEEQKEARLQAKAVELTQLAEDLLRKTTAKEKIKGFLKGKIAVKKAKELSAKKEEDDAGFLREAAIADAEKKMNHAIKTSSGVAIDNAARELSRTKAPAPIKMKLSKTYIPDSKWNNWFSRLGIYQDSRGRSYTLEQFFGDRNEKSMTSRYKKDEIETLVKAWEAAKAKTRSINPKVWFKQYEESKR